MLQEFSKQRYTGRHQGKGFKTTVTSDDFEKLETKAGPPPVMVNHVRRVEPKRRFTCIEATVERLLWSYAFFFAPLKTIIPSDQFWMFSIDSLTLVFCLLLGAMIWYVSSSHVAPPLLWMPLTSATVEQWGEVHAPASDVFSWPFLGLLSYCNKRSTCWTFQHKIDTKSVPPCLECSNMFQYVPIGCKNCNIILQYVAASVAAAG